MNILVDCIKIAFYIYQNYTIIFNEYISTKFISFIQRVVVILSSFNKAN